MSENKIEETTLWENLRQVVDPEIGCNIVDLGLIYSVAVAGPRVLVKMTLTTQGCPMHQSLIAGVENALLNVPGVEGVDVELVWDPPWNPSMMTQEGRAAVGYRET